MHATRSELTSATIGQDAFAYAYDNIGNRITYQHSFDNDADGCKASWTNSESLPEGREAERRLRVNIGNRKTAQETTENLAYETNTLNQYTSITEEEQGTLTPAFDADGNQTRLRTTTGEWNVVYDANNRPVRFTKTDGSAIIENGYDYMGRRYMQKVTVNGAVTRHERYIYRGHLQIAALDILNGEKHIHTLFWDPAEPVATRPLILLASDGNRYTYVHDLTKNVTELVDEQGSIAAAYDYDPFGKATATGSAAPVNPIQWSSEVYDPELALVYYNYRHYNPADGRWINRDPIAERGGYNLYGFVGNSSIDVFDVLGFKLDMNQYDTIPLNEIRRLHGDSYWAYTGAHQHGIAYPVVDDSQKDTIVVLEKTIVIVHM